MSDHLELFTLGGLVVKRNGIPITGLVSRKVEALLVYMACTGGTQPREVLAELFWEDRSQAQSMSNLRVVLTDLRRHLGHFVSISRQAVALNPDTPCWLDIADMEAGLRVYSESQAQEPRLSSQTAAQLEKTLALYKGDFLAGFHIPASPIFEDWIAAERERLRQQVVDALSRLVNYSLRHGAYTVGIAQAARLMQIDPLREETYRQSMLLLAQSGQRTAALAQYEACRRVLSEELQLKPDEKTTDLYHQLLAGEFSVLLPSTPRHHKLPTQNTPFIGRVSEVKQLVEYLNNPECRLLTLSGAGGVGKTRLALQVALKVSEAFADGVFMVPVAAINAPDFVIPAIGDALNLSFDSKQPPERQLVAFLQDKEMLLLLDNFEHLLDAAPLLSSLLASAAGLKIIVTTRERLQLQEEWLFTLDGMEFPEDVTVRGFTGYSAVQLFVETARRFDPNFDPNENRSGIVGICQLVEGLPLAIELAATWAHRMQVGHLYEELRRNFDLLATSVRNVPDRHRSLRASFEHSWNLLSEAEQRAFMQLSVFRGGFQREAVEQVVGVLPAVVISLVEKSLVQMNDRFNLHEVLRQFAYAKLGSAGLLEQARERHFEYYTRLAEEAGPQLRGQQQTAWLDRLDAECDNLRAALAWALERHESRRALRLGGALWPFWKARGHISEGRRWLDQALAENTDDNSRERAAAFHGAGILSLSQGAYFRAFTYLQESLAIARALTDAVSIAAALNGLGLVCWSQDDYGQACTFYEESLSIRQEISNKLGIASTLNNLGLLRLNQGNYARAQALYEQSLVLERDLDDKQGIASTLNNMGALACEQGRYVQARISLEESLSIRRELGDRYGTAGTLYHLGMLAFSESDLDQATSLFEQSLTLRRELEDRAGISETLGKLAIVALERGNLQSARLLAMESLAVVQETGFSRSASLVLMTLGRVNFAEGKDALARGCFSESLKIGRDMQDSAQMALCLAQLAHMECRTQPDRATRLYAAADAMRELAGSGSIFAQQIHFDEDLAALRANLDEAAFSTAWSEGQAMTIDEVAVSITNC